jgi:hypothetical protein
MKEWVDNSAGDFIIGANIATLIFLCKQSNQLTLESDVKGQFPSSLYFYLEAHILE